MVNIDPFYILVLGETSLVFAALCVYFFLQSRKQGKLCRKVLRDLLDLKTASSSSRSAETGAEAEVKQDKVDSAALDRIVKEKEELTAKINVIEGLLQEKSKLLEDLQKKHAALENEYAVLYGQHQAGQVKM